MGQKANPVSLRLGYIRGWESNWFGGKKFAEKLIGDDKIRKYLRARIDNNGLARIIIERSFQKITVTIQTSRPGVVIGKGGAEIEKIREELKKLTQSDVALNLFEIRRSEMDAALVADNIARQLEARVSFRRAMKMAIASTMRTSAEGIKVMVSGRLGGAEIARSEQYKEGRIPLHTLRADIDYSLREAQTVYGKIGVKVWIFKGEVFGKRDLSPVTGSSAGAGGGRTGDRPGGREGRGERRGGRGERGERGERGGERGERGERGGERRSGGRPAGGRQRI